MGLSLRIDTEKGLNQLDDFVAQAQTVAMPRALNNLRDRAATTGFKTISTKNDGITPSLMRKYTTLKFARGNDLVAAITVKGAGFPIINFGARQTKGGVSVRVKGRRFIIPHTFIATVNGHTGVFARGAYGAKSTKYPFRPTGQNFGHFIFGKGTLVRTVTGKHGGTFSPHGYRRYLSINELFTLSPADAFDDDDVVQAMNDRVQGDMQAVIEKEVRYVASQIA